MQAVPAMAQTAAYCMQVLDINMLMVIAVAGALALGNLLEAAGVVVLFGLAETLESRCTQAARDAIAGVLALKPDTAILQANGALLH